MDRELNRYNVDMAALSETRLADVGEAAEANYTFFWSGRAPHLKREAGIGFANNTSLAPKLCATLIHVYVPTMQYSDEDKEKFYSELRAVMDTVPKADKLIILGDFNARVGADWSAWDGVLGRHGVGQCNSNGQLLLELCMAYDLNITNTNFQLPIRNRTSLMLELRSNTVF